MSEGLHQNKEEKREELYESVTRKVDFLKGIMQEVQGATSGSKEGLDKWLTEKYEILCAEYPGLDEDRKGLLLLHKQEYAEKSVLNILLQKNNIVECGTDVLEKIQQYERKINKLRSDINEQESNDDLYFGYQVFKFLNDIRRKKGLALSALELYKEDKDKFFETINKAGIGGVGFGKRLQEVYKTKPEDIKVRVDGIHFIVQVDGRTIVCNNPGWEGFHTPKTPFIYVKGREQDPVISTGTLTHEKNHNYFDRLEIHKNVYANALRQDYKRYKRLKAVIPDFSATEFMYKVDNAIENLQGELLADVDGLFTDGPTTFQNYLREVRMFLTNTIKHEDDPVLKSALISSFVKLVEKIHSVEEDLIKLVKLAKIQSREDDLKALIIMYGVDTRRIVRHFIHGE